MIRVRVRVRGSVDQWAGSVVRGRSELRVRVKVRVRVRVRG